MTFRFLIPTSHVYPLKRYTLTLFLKQGAGLDYFTHTSKLSLLHIGKLLRLIQAEKCGANTTFIYSEFRPRIFQFEFDKSLFAFK